MRDLVSDRRPVKCGASGTTSTGFYIPKLMNEIFGAKFHIVTGYSGGAELDLAVQRGETQCRATSVSGYTGFGAFKDWRQTGSARVLVQTGRKRDPKLPDVPTVYELMDEFKTPESGRRLAAVMLVPGGVWLADGGAAGSGGGQDKASARGRFTKRWPTLNLIAEAKKRQLEVVTVQRRRLGGVGQGSHGATARVVERMKKCCVGQSVHTVGKNLRLATGGDSIETTNR